MAAVDYRQLQAPALIDTRTYDDGSAQAASSLASSFKQISHDATSLGTQINSQEGTKAGQLAGATGDPQFKDGFFKYSAYSQAYNNSAMRSYAIRAEANAEDNAARLEVQANNDPAHFQATFGAVRDETLKAAPPEARGVLADIYNKRMGEGTARLITGQQQQYLKEARVDVSEGVSRATDRIANWMAADDPVLHAQAEEEQVKLRLLIDGAKNDGTITETEAGSAFMEAQRAITSQTVVSRFKNELNNPYGDPVAFIERVQKANKDQQLLPPAEGEKLVTTLMSTLREKNALDSFDKRHNGTLEAARYAQGDKDGTALLLSGHLTEKWLLDAVTSQNIKPETARTLREQLEHGDTAKDDPKVAFDVKTDLLNYSEADIATKQGLTWKTRGELIEERRKAADGWRGTQAAKEGEQRIDRALGIIPGTMIQTLPDEVKTQRQQALTNWYNEVDAMDPAMRQGAAIHTAEDVVGRFVRKAKLIEAQDTRGAKARFIAGEQAAHGDPGSYGKDAKAAYDRTVAGYDHRISAAEAEAARK